MKTDAIFPLMIGVLCLLAILACFIGYATNTLPMHTPKQQAPVAMTTPVKKKPCHCCEERMARLRKAIQQGWKKAREKQQKAVDSSQPLLVGK